MTSRAQNKPAAPTPTLTMDALAGHKTDCRCRRCKKARGEISDVLVKGIWMIPSLTYGRLAKRAEEKGLSQAAIVRDLLDRGLNDLDKQDGADA